MFFNEKTSNFLQQVAVFIEVTGFILVIIEIYFPTTGRNIEKFIDRMSSIQNWYEEGIDKLALFIHLCLTIVIIIFIIDRMNISIKVSPTIMVILTAYIIIFLILFFILKDITFKNAVLGYLTFSLFVIPLIFLWILFLLSTLPMLLIFFPISKMLSFLNFIGKGKAIGAFGLILSLTGLCFEVYQVVTLCLSDGCYGS